MARVTVEDCLETIDNRFDLTLIAAKRARQLMRGSVDAAVAWDNDKATVVALREIAAGNVGNDYMFGVKATETVSVDPDQVTEEGADSASE